MNDPKHLIIKLKKRYDPEYDITTRVCFPTVTNTDITLLEIICNLLSRIEKLEKPLEQIYFESLSDVIPDDVPPSDCNDGNCHNCKYEFDCKPLTEEEKK